MLTPALYVYDTWLIGACVAFVLAVAFGGRVLRWLRRCNRRLHLLGWDHGSPYIHYEGEDDDE